MLNADQFSVIGPRKMGTDGDPSSTTIAETENRQFNEHTQNNGSSASVTSSAQPSSGQAQHEQKDANGNDEFDVFASPESFSTLEPFDRLSRRLYLERDRLPAHDLSLVRNNVPARDPSLGTNLLACDPLELAGYGIYRGQGSAAL